jgi:hypothetical protein
MSRRSDFLDGFIGEFIDLYDSIPLAFKFLRWDYTIVGKVIASILTIVAVFGFFFLLALWVSP